MFGLGFWEIVIILLVVLLILGPDKLGPIARAMGRAMREMRRGMDEFRDAFKVDEHVREIDAIRSEIVEEIESAAEDVEVVTPEETGKDGEKGKDG